MEEFIWVAIDPGLTGAVSVLWPRQLLVEKIVDSRVSIWDIPTIAMVKTKKLSKKTREARVARGLSDVATLDSNVRMYDFYGMYQMLKNVKEIADTHLFQLRLGVERVDSRGGDHPAAAAHIARARAVWEVITAIPNIPLELPPPSQWRPAMVGVGTDKNAARHRALQLFPECREQLRLVDHHNRAESLLLAEYLRRCHYGEQLPGRQTKSRRKKS